jgi:hypothetical protein
MQLTFICQKWPLPVRTDLYVMQLTFICQKLPLPVIADLYLLYICTSPLRDAIDLYMSDITFTCYKEQTMQWSMLNCRNDKQWSITQYMDSWRLGNKNSTEKWRTPVLRKGRSSCTIANLAAPVMLLFLSITRWMNKERARLGLCVRKGI